MDKARILPRIFLGSSTQQEKLLQALTRGLSDIAHVEPWTTSFTPGTSALERLVELTREVDFAAFVFAQDDWTTNSPSAPSQPGSGQASPRDNVVFEAGLFGGTLGMRRTFILHAHGAKLPTDLLGLTCVRYDAALTPSELKTINQKIRTAIENEGRVTRVEGSWWQFSLTERTAKKPSALSLLKISHDRKGALELTGRSWREDGSLSVRADALSIIREAMQIVYDYIPEKHKSPFNVALKSSTKYCGSYRELKSCLREVEGTQPDLNFIMRALKSILPMLGNSQRATLGKAINVLEVLKES